MDGSNPPFWYICSSVCTCFSFFLDNPFWGAQTIISDCGPQFTSNVWSQLCKMLHITHCQATAYHSESNGTVERLHHRLKDALHACTATATWTKCRGWDGGGWYLVCMGMCIKFSLAKCISLSYDRMLGKGKRCSVSALRITYCSGLYSFFWRFSDSINVVAQLTIMGQYVRKECISAKLRVMRRDQNQMAQVREVL